MAEKNGLVEGYFGGYVRSFVDAMKKNARRKKKKEKTAKALKTVPKGPAAQHPMDPRRKLPPKRRRLAIENPDGSMEFEDWED